MKDMQTHLEEMRTDAADIVVLKSVTAERLARLAESTSGAAFEIEKATESPNVPYAESRTLEFCDRIADADREQAAAAADAASNNEEPGTDRESVPVHEEMLVAHQEQPTQIRRGLPWLSVMILIAIAGAFAIANNGLEQSWSSAPFFESKAKALALAAAPEELKPAVAAPEALQDLQRVEREERLPSEQAASLTAPVDHLERAGAAHAERMSNLGNARAEIVEPTTRRVAARPSRHRKSVVTLQRGNRGGECLWCGNSSRLRRFGLFDLFAWHPKYRRQFGVRHPT
jgi:hypothetical protein